MAAKLYHEIELVLPSEMYGIEPEYVDEGLLMCRFRTQFGFKHDNSNSKLGKKCIYGTNWLFGNMRCVAW